MAMLTTERNEEENPTSLCSDPSRLFLDKKVHTVSPRRGRLAALGRTKSPSDSQDDFIDPVCDKSRAVFAIPHVQIQSLQRVGPRHDQLLSLGLLDSNFIKKRTEGNMTHRVLSVGARALELTVNGSNDKLVHDLSQLQTLLDEWWYDASPETRQRFMAALKDKKSAGHSLSAVSVISFPTPRPPPLRTIGRPHECL